MNALPWASMSWCAAAAVVVALTASRFAEAFDGCVRRCRRLRDDWRPWVRDVARLLRCCWRARPGTDVTLSLVEAASPVAPIAAPEPMPSEAMPPAPEPPAPEQASAPQHHDAARAEATLLQRHDQYVAVCEADAVRAPPPVGAAVIDVEGDIGTVVAHYWCCANPAHAGYRVVACGVLYDNNTQAMVPCGRLVDLGAAEQLAGGRRVARQVGRA